MGIFGSCEPYLTSIVCSRVLDISCLFHYCLLSLGGHSCLLSLLIQYCLLSLPDTILSRLIQMLNGTDYDIFFAGGILTLLLIYSIICLSTAAMSGPELQYMYPGDWPWMTSACVLLSVAFVLGTMALVAHVSHRNGSLRHVVVLYVRNGALILLSIIGFFFYVVPIAVFPRIADKSSTYIKLFLLLCIPFFIASIFTIGMLCVCLYRCAEWLCRMPGRASDNGIDSQQDRMDETGPILMESNPTLV